jgi:tetratricopeptide (TPR) repeat protein
MRDLDWIEKGRILERAGVAHESFRQYTNAVSVASETSRPYFKKAEVLIDYDKFEDAKKEILDGLSRDPDSITGHKLLIQIMEPIEIIEELDTKFSKFSNNKEIASLLAYKLVDLEPKIALDFLVDNNFSDLILKVQCLKNLGKINEAFDFSKKAININPKKISGWISAGWCLYELENFGDAEGYFEAALGIDISNPDALLGKALILKSKDKDFSYYNKALEAIDPNLVI